MRNRRSLLSDPGGGWEIWPSFTDVMSTMALILFVLVLLAYVRNLISGRQIEAFRRQIDLSAQQLRTLEHAARGAARRSWSSRKPSCTTSRPSSPTPARSSRRCARSSEASRSCGYRFSRRSSEPSKPSSARRATAGSDLVTIGDGGNILINESLVFEFDSYALKKDAKPLLDALGRAFANVLADPAVRSNIDTILIQGHTDDRGTPSHNWDLSAKRATAVVDYILETNKGLADAYGSYFAAAACSKFRPGRPRHKRTPLTPRTAGSRSPCCRRTTTCER